MKSGFFSPIEPHRLSMMTHPNVGFQEIFLFLFASKSLARRGNIPPTQAIEGRKRTSPPPFASEGPLPTRQRMARISAAISPRQSQPPQSINRPPMARISAALAARQPSPAPQGMAESCPAEEINFPSGVRMTDAVPTMPASQAFKTATARVKFSAEWKGPFHRPGKQRFNDDVRLEDYKPAALSFADKQRRGDP